MNNWLKREIWRKAGEAIADYNMIQDGDTIAIGVSGGKDSLLLSHVLSRLQKKAPIKFKLTAITLDMGFDPDLSQVRRFMAELDIPYHVEKTQIGAAIQDELEGGNPCNLCSHLRRGILYQVAKDLGANKVALAHHRDDAIETLLLSMVYEGRIRCFQPAMYSDRQELTLIRPLIYVSEQAVREAVSILELPVVHNPCPANGNTKRQEIKELLTNYQQQNPLVKENLLHTLGTLWKADKGQQPSDISHQNEIE